MYQWNNETAEWYAKKYGECPTNHLGVDQLDIPEGCVIVDVGCGTGSALRHAVSKIQDGVLIGVDPVPRMIEIARESTVDYPGSDLISFQIGSAEDLPINQNFADIVLAFDSIDHWENIHKGLSEIKRILKTTGQFVILRDKSVPKSVESVEQAIMSLSDSGYEVVSQTEHKSDEVSFSLLICSIS